MYSKTLSYLEEIKELEKHQEHISWLYLKTNDDMYQKLFENIELEISRLNNFIHNLKQGNKDEQTN